MRLFTSQKKQQDSGVDEFEVESVSSQEFRDLPQLPGREVQLETLSAEAAAAALRVGKPLAQKRITGDLILGREDLKNPFELDLKDGSKRVMVGFSTEQAVRKDFRPKIELTSCVFEGRVILAGLNCKADVTVMGTRFCDEVDFQQAVFHESALFSGCCFEGKATFSDAVFWKAATFDRTFFREYADFFNVICHEGADFFHAVFDQTVVFSQSRFKEVSVPLRCLNLKQIVCHEDAHFQNVCFEGIADFSAAQFRRRADFSGAVFRYIRLTQTRFGWLEVKWEQIGGDRLLIGPLVFSGTDVCKPTLTDRDFKRYFRDREDAPLPEKHRHYDILKQIFLKQGDYVSADACLYDWKQIERRESKLGWNPENWFVKAFHYFNWISCGYGIKPIRTLFFAATLILLFGAIYTVLGTPITPAILTALPASIEFSFLAFMNFTSESAGLGPVAHALFLAEQLLGWLTLLLFVATYTRILLR